MSQMLARHLAALGLSALCAAMSAPAAADVGLSASFRDPTGTVGPTDVVDVWITLRSTGTEALTFDETAGFPFGLPSSLVPLVGSNSAQQLFDVPFGSYTSVGLFTYRFCNDSFEGCGPGGAYESSVPNSPDTWFSVISPFSLAPGASRDILLYQLTPVGTGAAPGTYQLFNVGLGLTVRGLAADGVTPLEADAFSPFTCDGLSQQVCSFDRTVVAAIPEPASLLLLLGGLAAVGGWTGRQHKKAAGFSAR